MEFQVRYSNIGIKQKSLSIYICWTPRVAKGLEVVNEAGNHVPSPLSDYCIKSFLVENFGQKSDLKIAV